MNSNLALLNHRSKKRIQDLGEVFTPEAYVEEMLDLLAKDKKNFWSDEDVVFFEPCCGHGNIVLPLFRRRLDSIYKKAIMSGFGKSRDAALYAVANTLNSIWAIDIDPKNIENTRSRVFQQILVFLKDKLGSKTDMELITKNKNYFAHILSAIRWHIDENETLSALSPSIEAQSHAELTKSGSKWFSNNGHNEIDFELTWVNFYESCEESNTIPMEFERSLKFLESALSGRLKGYEDYNFVKVVLSWEMESKQNELGA